MLMTATQVRFNFATGVITILRTFDDSISAIACVCCKRIPYLRFYVFVSICVYEITDPLVFVFEKSFTCSLVFVSLLPGLLLYVSTQDSTLWIRPGSYVDVVFHCQDPTFNDCRFPVSESLLTLSRQVFAITDRNSDI